MTRMLICFLPLFFCAQAFAWDMQMYMPVDENGNQVQLNRTHDDGKNKLALKPGEIDSTEIYYNLIAEENLDASYSQNVTGMIWGAALTGVGTAVFVGGLIIGRSRGDDLGDALGAAILGAHMMVYSAPVILIGLPVLGFNIYFYNVHKNHAMKSDEYQKSLESYRKRHSVAKAGVARLMLLPTVNVANAGAGLMLTGSF